MEIRMLGPNESPPMDLLLSADPSERIVREYLERGQCYVAELSEAVIAVYVLLPTRPNTVELVNIAVHEDHQSRGIGKQLVHHAIHNAKLQGYKTIEVGTGNSGIGQLALYQKCGFRMIGIDRDFFVRHYAEEIVENGIPCRDMVRLSQEI
ncbi:GNAT family N-acetyltransferase [Paenibacillus sp. FSL H7-0331]|uniref:GNAT family N-acetyltransferase n=1 Tax=Paenibacillus sp. FSL H7-0331 TaxID=1920421 RepID=UPI00096C130D|nr:GNAT family N-acetyltransferase [Paenibacillus sp. FSL H7-0331]OMF15909.1 GNAT family N-acetyltransferase [Paenibacillus sp. FSL H7-0331]